MKGVNFDTDIISSGIVISTAINLALSLDLIKKVTTATPRKKNCETCSEHRTNMLTNNGGWFVIWNYDPP